MNPREIIESGQLELYVLGQLSEVEIKEVETWRQLYPEVEAAIQEIEANLEVWAKQQARTAPAHIQAELEAKLFSQASPSVQAKPRAPLWLWSLAISGWAGAAFVLFWNGLQASNYQQLQHQYNLLSTQAQRESEYCEEVASLLRDSSTQKLILPGTSKLPEAKLLVYWNANKGLVHLASEHMPALESRQQYQLWAIVDGQPVDLGLLDKELKWQKMRALKASPQAFAVTLEPLGGMPEPTLEQLVVFGKSS